MSNNLNVTNLFQLKSSESILEYERMAEIGFEKRDFRMVSCLCCLALTRRLVSAADASLLSLQVVFCMDRALEAASGCHRFKILKAECLALLGRYPEAQSVAR